MATAFGVGVPWLDKVRARFWMRRKRKEDSL
jgi:hypothetical protein